MNISKMVGLIILLWDFLCCALRDVSQGFKQHNASRGGGVERVPAGVGFACAGRVSVSFVTKQSRFPSTSSGHQTFWRLQPRCSVHLHHRHRGNHSLVLCRWRSAEPRGGGGSVQGQRGLQVVQHAHGFRLPLHEQQGRSRFGAAARRLRAPGEAGEGPLGCLWGSFVHSKENVEVLIRQNCEIDLDFFENEM